VGSFDNENLAPKFRVLDGAPKGLLLFKVASVLSGVVMSAEDLRGGQS
jgi:hypothetical protein